MLGAGAISLDIEAASRCDCGRKPSKLTRSANGAVFDAGDDRLNLSLVLEDDDAKLALRETAVLQTGSEKASRVMRPATAQRLMDNTAHFWQDWLRHSTTPDAGGKRPRVLAITPKLLDYAPRGASRPCWLVLTDVTTPDALSKRC